MTPPHHPLLLTIIGLVAPSDALHTQVFDAYCSKTLFTRDTVRFLFSGQRVNPSSTVADYELKDGDAIFAMSERLGD
jgi:hypothetical protein